MDAVDSGENICVTYALHTHAGHDEPGWLRPIRESWIMIPMLCGVAVTLHPSPWTVTPMLGIVGVLVLRMRLRARTIAAHAGRSNLVSNASVVPRFSCTGIPEELDSLKEVTGEFFEPMIVLFSRVPTSRRMTVLILAGCVALPVLTKVVLLPLVTGVLLTAVLCYVIAWLFYAFPIYYRIVPGRLEMLTSSWLRSRLTKVHVIPLARARIEARFDKQRLFIDLPPSDATFVSDDPAGVEERPKRYEIDLGSTCSAHRFVTGLFRAAISSHVAPELPEAQLLA